MKFSDLKEGYKSLWEKCEVTRQSEATKQARAFLAVKSRYMGYPVPWFVVGIIHTREAGSPPDFKACLHNGERIIGTGRKTRLVPANRGPFTTWDTATNDALRIDHLEEITWDDGWGPEHVAYALECFNGFGYRKHGIPSPYLWGGTNVQQRGKYVSDGKYDAGTMDPQIGGMALLKTLMALDPSVTFDKAPEQPPVVEPPVGPPKPPKPPTVPVGHVGFGSLLAAVAAYFHQHWPVLVGIAVGGVIVYSVYRYLTRHVPLSPKAIENDIPVGPTAVDAGGVPPAPSVTPTDPVERS